MRAPERAALGLVEPQLKFIDRDPKGLGWIVVGGESGKPRTKARPFHVEWAEVLVKRCKAAGVSFFFKQLGSIAAYRGQSWPTAQYAGTDPEEWRPRWRIREYPRL